MDPTETLRNNVQRPPGRRAVIYTGGELGPWALAIPRQGDYIIGADRGAAFLVRHRFTPDLAVGDFDSVSPVEFEAIQAVSGQTERCDPIDKDCSDTELAFRAAIESGSSEIIILGATGSRFDHSLANVHLLRKSLELGIPCRLLDACNEIQLTDRTLTIANPGQTYRYVSLLPLSLQVTGVTLSGFRYPLQDAVLELGQSVGLTISNELIAEQGTIQVESGLLLVIQSTDSQEESQ